MIDAAKNDSRLITLQERLNELESEIAREKQLLKKAQNHITGILGLKGKQKTAPAIRFGLV